MTIGLMTLGQLAAGAGVEFHVARCIVQTRGIAPTMRARQYRLFDQVALELVKREVERIRQRKRPSRTKGQ